MIADGKSFAEQSYPSSSISSHLCAATQIRMTTVTTTIISPIHHLTDLYAMDMAARMAHMDIIAHGYRLGVDHEMPPPPPLQRAERYFYCPIADAGRFFRGVKLPRCQTAILYWVKAAATQPLYKLKADILGMRQFFSYMGPAQGVDVAILHTLRTFAEREDVSQTSKDQLGLAIRMLIIEEHTTFLAEHTEDKMLHYKELLSEYDDTFYTRNALERIRDGPIMPMGARLPAHFKEDLQISYAAMTARLHLEDEHYRPRRQLVYHARTLYRRYYALMGVLNGSPLTHWWVDAMLMHVFQNNAQVEALCRLAGVALSAFPA
jgi:hypothetical protein